MIVRPLSTTSTYLASVFVTTPLFGEPLEALIPDERHHPLAQLIFRARADDDDLPAPLHKELGEFAAVDAASHDHNLLPDGQAQFREVFEAFRPHEPGDTTSASDEGRQG